MVHRRYLESLISGLAVAAILVGGLLIQAGLGV